MKKRLTAVASDAPIAPSEGLSLAYGMEAIVVELATDPLLLNVKLAELKPDTHPVLAGMLLAWHARAKALHQDILAALEKEKRKQPPQWAGVQEAGR